MKIDTEKIQQYLLEIKARHHFIFFIEAIEKYTKNRSTP
jgi:hypothetical protein